MTAGEPVVRFAARGDGVTASGRYVPGGVPGDTVNGESLCHGPHHRAPPCRHFGDCGGCQLQHADDIALAQFVSGRIVAALSTAGVVPAHVHGVHLSPPGSRRRASLRAQCAGDAVRVGFNAPQSHRIVPLAECAVLTPALWRIVVALRDLLPGIVAGTAVAIAITETATGTDMLIEGGIRTDSASRAMLADFGRTFAVARIAHSDESGTSTLAERAVPQVLLDGVPVALPHAAFLQATADGEAALQAAVQASTIGAKRVADLFCGVGTFALPLSVAARVAAVDAAGPAVAALGAAAKAADRRVETAHRDLYRRPLDKQELAAFDAVVLDPPRAGAETQVREIARSTVPRVAYVSCNPATFARDAKLLATAGFRLTELWPVGQFRWSTHVELAAAFVR
jgi:23S rRNA (uracil1939-C5)-methyltransferase